MRSAQCNNVFEIVVKKTNESKKKVKWQLPVFHEELRNVLCAMRDAL